MKWLAMVIVVGGLLARFFMITMDDTALRDDVLFSELMTSQRQTVDAAILAPEIERLIKLRKCELVPDSLQIDVKDARMGTLSVQGAGLQVQSANKGPVSIQDIHIQFRCRRPGVFFLKTQAVYSLNTQAYGEGRANHWPRSGGEDAQAQQPQ